MKIAVWLCVAFGLCRRGKMSFDYSDYTLAELRYIGKKIGVKSPTSLRKADLIARINEVSASCGGSDLLRSRIEDLEGEIVKRKRDLENHKYESVVFHKLDVAFLNFMQEVADILKSKE